MKKLILTILPSLLAFGFNAKAEWSVDWKNVPNEAFQKEVVVSSKPKDAQLITDGNEGNRWQAVPGISDPDYNDWVLIDFGANTPLTVVEIKWEASRATEFDVYLTEDDLVYETRNQDGKGDFKVVANSWFGSHAPVVSATTEGEDGDYYSNISFNASGRYLIIYCKAYNGNGKNYGSSIYEVRAANLSDALNVDHISVSPVHTTKGTPVNVSINAFNKFNQLLNDFDNISSFSLKCDDSEIEIKQGTPNNYYSVIANKIGTYTLKASAKLADGTELNTEAEFIATINWNETTNIALNNALMGRLRSSSEDTSYEHLASAATDGNSDTYYEYDGDWGGGNGWVIVDLKEEKDITAVEVFFGEKSGGFYGIAYGSELNLPEDTNYDQVWNEFNKTLQWENIAALSRNSNEIASYVFQKPIRARYITIHDVDNPNGKPQYREIYIADETVRDEAIPSSIILTASADYISSDEEIILTSTIYNQFGEKMDITDGFKYECNNETIEGTVSTLKVSSPNQFGVYSYTVSYNDLNSEEIPVYVVALGDDKFDANVLNHTISVTSEEDSQTIDRKFNQEINGDHGFALNSTLKINFIDKALNLDLIKLNWEAACPSDYTVNAIFEDGHSEEILNVEGRAFVGGVNPVDRIYSSANLPSGRKNLSSSASNLHGVVALEIHPTAKDHGYSLRLLSVNLYGDAEDSQTFYLYADGLTVNGDGQTIHYNPSFRFNKSETNTYILNVAKISNGQTFQIEDNAGVLYGSNFDKDEFIFNGGSQIEIIADATPIKVDGSYVNVTFTLTVDGGHYYLLATGTATTDGLYLTPGNDKTNQSGVVSSSSEAGVNGNIVMQTMNDFALVFVYSSTQVYYDYVIDTDKESVKALAADSYEWKPAEYSDKDGAFIVKLPNEKTGILYIATSEDATSPAQTYAFEIQRSVPTGVESAEVENAVVDIYTLSGVTVAKGVNFNEVKSALTPGLYIVGGKKVIVK